MRLPQRLRALALCLAALAALPLPASADITAGLIKIPDPASPGKWVFPANSEHVLDPNLAEPGDHALAIQRAIDAVEKPTNSTGTVIFIKAGTYHLKRTLLLRGSGVTLVGLKGLVSDSNGTSVSYPIFTYGDDLVDEAYNGRAVIQQRLGGVTVDVLENPAVIRINGNEDYGPDTEHRNHGLRGFIVRYIGTNTSSAGGMATALALHEGYHSPVQDVTIEGKGIGPGPWNGIDVGPSMMPLVHNVTIKGVRGEFGLRAGGKSGAGAQKYHGLTITAPINAGSQTELIRVRAESEFIGARLVGGGVGMNICGRAIQDDYRLANITLRSVLIQKTARQGILVNNAQGIGMTDIQIDEAGAEGIRVGDFSLPTDPSLPTTQAFHSGFLGGLQMLNIRINKSGFSALRVDGGMNISVANAVLLNSGQKKTLTSDDIAGIYLGRAVTAFNLVGARIGSSESDASLPGMAEDWGIYWSVDPVAYAPWHSPKVIATHVNFFPNIAEDERCNRDEDTFPEGDETLNIESTGGYYPLHGAGYFPAPGSLSPLMGDTWATQKLPTDPEFGDSWLKVAKGYNWFDLPELRDTPWIDLTVGSLSVVTVTVTTINEGKINEKTITEGTINASAFASRVNEAAAMYSQGAVLYLPSGKFTGLNTAAPSFTPMVYELPPGGDRLLINKPKIQFVGGGHDVTQITVPHQTESASLPPLDDVIKFTAGSTGSGVFGLSVNYNNEAYDTKPATGWPNVVYGAAFRVEGTSGIRLVNLGSNYGMGPCVSLVNSTDCSLYQIWARNAVNNGRAQQSNAIYRLTGTTENSTNHIRLFQVFGSGLANLGPDAKENWNVMNDLLPYGDLPELDHVRIEGGVNRVRVDCSTFIQGKNGLTVSEHSSLIPGEISAFRFATDHVQKAFNLVKAKDCDFLACWTNASYMVAHVGKDVTGDIRFSNMVFRGGNLEGASLRGGHDINIVNCQTGRSCGITDVNGQENRPLAGMFVGGNVTGKVTVVGGMSGWLWYRYNSPGVLATSNGNRQDWGLVLASEFPPDRYFSYGFDVFGNGDEKSTHKASPPGFHRGVGTQNSANSQHATWLTDDPNNHP